jgi:ubiquinone biosynthesis protein UbiJ
VTVTPAPVVVERVVTVDGGTREVIKEVPAAAPELKTVKQIKAEIKRLKKQLKSLETRLKRSTKSKPLN